MLVSTSKNHPINRKQNMQTKFTKIVCFNRMTKVFSFLSYYTKFTFKEIQFLQKLDRLLPGIKRTL